MERRGERTYKEALAYNIQHYIDRGYSEQLARIICEKSEEEVFRVYDIIQEEKEIAKRLVPVPVEPLGYTMVKRDWLEKDNG